MVIESLTIWEWDVRSRLKSCHHSILILLNPNTKELPEKLYKRLEKVEKEMTKYPAENEFETSVDRTMKKIYNKTASKLALELFNIYHEMISDD